MRPSIDERAYRELVAERDQLRARVADWENAAQQGHPDPCTLGPLCPYCEIERLRAIAVVDRAAREAFEADNARLRERGREVLIHIMRSHKASIGSIDSHYTPQLSVTKIHEIAKAFGIKP